MELGILIIMINVQLTSSNESLKQYINEEFFDRIEESDIDYHFMNNHKHYDKLSDIFQESDQKQKVDEVLHARAALLKESRERELKYQNERRKEQEQREIQQKAENENALQEKRILAEQRMQERIRDLARQKNLETKNQMLLKEEQEREHNIRKEQQKEEQLRMQELRRQQQLNQMKKKQLEEQQKEEIKEKERIEREEQRKREMEEWLRRKNYEEKRKNNFSISKIMNRKGSSFSNKNISLNGIDKNDVSQQSGLKKSQFQNKKKSVGQEQFFDKQDKWKGKVEEVVESSNRNAIEQIYKLKQKDQLLNHQSAKSHGIQTTSNHTEITEAGLRIMNHDKKKYLRKPKYNMEQTQVDIIQQPDLLPDTLDFRCKVAGTQVNSPQHTISDRHQKRFKLINETFVRNGEQLIEESNNFIQNLKNKALMDKNNFHSANLQSYRPEEERRHGHTDSAVLELQHLLDQASKSKTSVNKYLEQEAKESQSVAKKQNQTLTGFSNNIFRQQSESDEKFNADGQLEDGPQFLNQESSSKHMSASSGTGTSIEQQRTGAHQTIRTHIDERRFGSGVDVQNSETPIQKHHLQDGRQKSQELLGNQNQQIELGDPSRQYGQLYMHQSYLNKNMNNEEPISMHQYQTNTKETQILETDSQYNSKHTLPQIVETQKLLSQKSKKSRRRKQSNELWSSNHKEGSHLHTQQPSLVPHEHVSVQYQGPEFFSTGVKSPEPAARSIYTSFPGTTSPQPAPGFHSGGVTIINNDFSNINVNTQIKFDKGNLMRKKRKKKKGPPAPLTQAQATHEIYVGHIEKQMNLISGQNALRFQHHNKARSGSEVAKASQAAYRDLKLGQAVALDKAKRIIKEAKEKSRGRQQVLAAEQHKQNS